MFFKKNKEKEYEFIVTQEEHVANLIKKTEEDLVNSMIQQWIYQREYLNPVHIGKNEAHENVLKYQKRCDYLKENLEVYKLYARQKGIVI